MYCVIVYWSRYGHGEKLVEHLSKKLEENDIETKSYKPGDLDPKDMPEADIYVFSSPTEAFRIKRDMRKFMKQIKDMENKNYGVINTHGMKRNWLKNMEKILNKKGMVKIAEADFKIGKEGAEEGRALPEDWQDRLDAFVEEMTKKV